MVKDEWKTTTLLIKSVEIPEIENPMTMPQLFFRLVGVGALSVSRMGDGESIGYAALAYCEGHPPRDRAERRYPMRKHNELFDNRYPYQSAQPLLFEDGPEDAHSQMVWGTGGGKYCLSSDRQPLAELWERAAHE